MTDQERFVISWLTANFFRMLTDARNALDPSLEKPITEQQASIVSNALRDYLSSDKKEPAYFDLNQIIRDTLANFQSQLFASIDMPATFPPLLGKKEEITALFQNLFESIAEPGVMEKPIKVTVSLMPNNKILVQVGFPATQLSKNVVAACQSSLSLNPSEGGGMFLSLINAIRYIQRYLGKFGILILPEGKGFSYQIHFVGQDMGLPQEA